MVVVIPSHVMPLNLAKNSLYQDRRGENPNPGYMRTENLWAEFIFTGLKKILFRNSLVFWLSAFVIICLHCQNNTFRCCSVVFLKVGSRIYTQNYDLYKCVTAGPKGELNPIDVGLKIRHLIVALDNNWALGGWCYCYLACPPLSFRVSIFSVLIYL